MSRFKVYVTATAWGEIKSLPGHMRNRVRHSIDALANNPWPSTSQKLDSQALKPELRRIRLDRWRIVYAIWKEDSVVDILAVRKRPPYDYGDLEQLFTARS